MNSEIQLVLAYDLIICVEFFIWPKVNFGCADARYKALRLKVFAPLSKVTLFDNQLVVKFVFRAKFGLQVITRTNFYLDFIIVIVGEINLKILYQFFFACYKFSIDILNLKIKISLDLLKICEIFNVFKNWRGYQVLFTHVYFYRAENNERNNK